jgi:hypothetical protein
VSEALTQSHCAPAPDYASGLPPDTEVCGCDESLALRAELARLQARVRRLLARRAAPASAGPRKRKGISWHAASGKFRARVQVDGKRVYLGAFSSEDEAAAAVDCALRIKAAKGAVRG